MKKKKKINFYFSTKTTPDLVSRTEFETMFGKCKIVN